MKSTLNRVDPLRFLLINVGIPPRLHLLDPSPKWIATGKGRMSATRRVEQLAAQLAPMPAWIGQAK